MITQSIRLYPPLPESRRWRWVEIFMRSRLVVLIITIICWANIYSAEPATKEEIVHAADAIAVVDVIEIPHIGHRTREPNVVYNVSMAASTTAKVTRVISGDLPDIVEFNYSVNPYYDDDNLLRNTGKYLVFLTRHGTNIRLLTRETIWKITEEKLNWFGRTLPIQDVINDIKAQEKLRKKPNQALHTNGSPCGSLKTLNMTKQSSSIHPPVPESRG